MRARYIKIIITALLVCVTFNVQNINGQSYKGGMLGELQQGLSIVPKIGINAFYGDLVDKSRASYSLGATADREMTEYFTVRLSLMGGQMTGKQINPNYNKTYATFSNVYIDFMGGATYKPLDHMLAYFRERTFEPYVLAQLGFVYYNATERWGEVAPLITPGTGDYKVIPGEVWRKAQGVAPIVSAGAGVDIRISAAVNINVEFHGNLAFTDRLDAHDVWYGAYPDGEVHETKPYDFYYIATAGFIYTIQDSQFKNHPKYSRASYLKARKGYKPTRKKVTKRRPKNHRRKTKRFLFF